jgi:putative membrane protein
MKEMKKLMMTLCLAMMVMFIGHSVATAQDGSMNGKDKMSKDKMSKDKMSSMEMNSTDTEFANMAAMGGNAEIAWGKLAMTKSTNKNVQKYASKMVKDHTKASKNLMKVAMKHNMTLPTTMSDDQTQVMSQLQQASGADFDRMYLQMSGVDAHQKMLALFQGEVSGGADADLKSFATKTLPVVQMHLQMAQDMANGGMSGDKGMKSGSMNH